MTFDELLWHLQFLTADQRDEIFRQIGNNVLQITPHLYKSKIEWPYPLEELRIEVEVGEQ